MQRIASHPAGGAILVIGSYGSFNYPPVTTPNENGSLAIRLDATGTPQAAFATPATLKDAAINASGSVLLAAELGGDNFGGFTLPRPNGQNIAGMIELNPDLTPQLARSVSGLKGFEFDSPTRVAMARNGDALLAGNFFGTNVVFGPLVARAGIYSAGAFLAKLGTPALPAISARRSTDHLRLTWPASDNFLLERIDFLGGLFSTFNYVAATNTADGTVTVDIPTSHKAAFFRLRKP